MRGKLKQWFVSCVIGVSFYYIGQLCILATDGFSVARIHSELAYNPKWETAPLSLQEQSLLNNALSQKYRYLSCGGQCFAFESEDGNYVIKFFKHKIRKPHTFLLGLCIPGFWNNKCKSYLNKALIKHNRDFTSYKIAYEQLREESGLIYLHLNKGACSHSLRIVDKIGIEHLIDLNNVEFIVQKKAQLFFAYIQELMQKKQMNEARCAIRDVLHLMITRCQKGVFDEDPGIHRNLGFFNNQPIFIDIGRFVTDFSRKEKAVYMQDLFFITKRFKAFLLENYPTLVPILEEELHALQI